MYLRCFISEHPHKWVSFLPWAEFWYNTAFHTSIGITPFKVLYGRDPLNIISLSVNDGTPPDLRSLLSSVINC